MDVELVRGLAFSAAMLLALAIVYEVSYFLPARLAKAKPYLNGLLIAVIGIGVMMLPVTLESGIIFDTRTILISVTALLFGSIPTVIVVLATIIYRCIVGGAGALMGVATILVSAGIGIAWRRFRLDKRIKPRWFSLYLLGVAVHLAMLACALLLPWKSAFIVLRQIWAPILLIYPVCTVLLSLLLMNQKERNEALIRVAETEGYYKSLFENNHAAMMLIRPATGQIVDVNQAAIQFYGWSRETMQQMAISQVNSLSDEEIKTEMNLALQEKRNVFHFKHRVASGEVFDVQVYSGPITIKGETYLYSIVHDVSRQIVAERALKESETHFRLLVEGSPIAIFIETNRKFAYVNKAVLELFGAERPEQLLGTPVMERFHPDYHDIISSRIAQLSQGQAVPHNEEVFLRLDGSPVVVDTTAVPIHYNQLDGAIAYATDITDRKRMEDAKLELEAQLRQQQKLEAIGTLAGGVAHEINNPINGIMNYAELILGKLDPETKQAEFTREIIHETERISVIVKNLLQFSRQEKQSHSYASIYDIINQTISLINTIIKKDSITMELDLDEGLAEMKCRSQQIQQVLMNLLTNARDALNEKFPGYDENKVIRLICRQYEESRRRWTRIVVEDRGNGIPPDLRDKIFEPFFSTKPKEKGTGLGLSISYGIVKDHHGKLSIDSEQGQYTRMILDLPVDNGWEL